jgi:serine phosphatase RsbU (regulator of sigma subunit)
MPRRFLVFLFLGFALTAFGQQTISKTDSLTTVLETAKDLDKIKILLELSDLNIYEETGLGYATQAYNLSKSIKNLELEAEALNVIGKCYIIDLREEQALETFFNALAIAESIKNNVLIGKTNRNIGQAYFWLDSLDKSKTYTQKALDISLVANDKLLEGNALLDLGLILSRANNTDSALINMHRALDIFIEKKAMIEVAIAYSRIGRVYFDMGDYRSSIDFHQKEIEVKESVNDLNGLAYAYYNFGRTHRTIGNYQLALEQYQKSLKVFERLNSRPNIAQVSSEIGFIYENLSRSSLAVEGNEANYRKALEFHETALKLFQDEGDSPKVAQTLNNIANCYSRLAINQYISIYGEFWEDSLAKLSSNSIMTSFEKAFEFYNKTLEISTDINDSWMAANVNINLGSHYIYSRNWQKARESLNNGLRLAKKSNFSFEESYALYNLGELNYRQGNFENAEISFIQSLKITSDLGIKEMMMHTHQRLTRVYERIGNLGKAIQHLKAYNLIKDELYTEQSQKAITEMQTKYETDKKEQEIKLLNNERELQHSVIQRQKLTLAITIGGLLVILAFAGLLINMVRQKQRANKILEEKNELISHQKQEITDSIRYASRIQNAILPSASILKDAIDEHFVLFLPRDIVSGDFYWFTKQQNKMVLAAADCTGHGVPGAFMSMLGVSFLYEIVNKESIMQPSKILDTLRDFVKLTLSQTGKQNEQKDGMDISLSVLDLENMRLEWAGAYNPLVLIRDGEIIEYKADKMPVAIHITDHQPFTNHVIDLKPNDRFYMYSDGFPDQFGGNDGRKFMSKRFKQLLLDIHQKPMEEQKIILHQEHLAWRGDTDQIDDIVVFGVKV